MTGEADFSISSAVGGEAGRHARLEREFIEHVRRLLLDERLRVDTKLGSRPVTGFRQHVVEGDELVSLRQFLAETGVIDRAVEAGYPQGRSLEVALQRRKWFVLAETVGQLHVKVLAPVRALVREEGVRAVTVTEVQRALESYPASVGGGGGPSTVVLVSTSGFVPEARDLAERRSGRTVVLVEPNGAGGWRVHGPAETRAIAELFDPEREEGKRKRVREYVAARGLELGGSGLAAEKVAAATMLPVQLVEAELKSLAKETAGWAARRLDGRLVLYRQGAVLQPTSSPGEPAMIDRIKALFERKGDTEKKIAYLSERRAALGQQRDLLYEELAAFEAKETGLKGEFKTAASSLAKKRITSQLLQLRKDAERRQQLLTVLNQQVGVVGVHLHNLELARTGTAQGLPTSDEIAEDAAKAEQVLAELQASSELAEGVGGGLASGLSDEEAALMAELEAENAPPTADAAPTPATAPAAPVRAGTSPSPMRISGAGERQPERNTPEPG